MENTKHKILFIEDNKVDQMAFMRMLKDTGLPYDCTVAGSVSQARSILGSQKFDIVIVDYLLGDGTAFDILDSVEDAPVVLITGVGDEEIAVKAWKAGAYDYLIKDVERNYLKALPITVERGLSIIMIFDTDIGNSVGSVMARETEVTDNIISIDEISVDEGTFVDIGEAIIEGKVVPVSIKSLVFAKSTAETKNAN